MLGLVSTIMHLSRFDEAITYFCVACEYNLRLSKQCTLPMSAMDSQLLLKGRRLCFQVSVIDLDLERRRYSAEYRRECSMLI